MRIPGLITAGLICIAAVPLHAQPGGPAGTEMAEPLDKGQWITLGTRAGPLASATRSQPANLLVAGRKHIVVDAGDGVTGRLAALGIATAQIDAVFISHLHFDHTAGLAALLGLRFQTNAPPGLRIYGPPGTQQLVDGLIASMAPGAAAGYGLPGAPTLDVDDLVEVIELRDRDTLEINGVTVSARNNTHYSFAPGSSLSARYESLSFRFDLPGRSIVYTGDTGPSAAVEELAQGADLLVTEMMDVDDTIAAVRRNSPNLPAPVALAMERHLREHHLLPQDVGQLAAKANVGAVVVTHFAGREVGDPAHLEYLRAIAASYGGPTVIANDLDAF